MIPLELVSVFRMLHEPGTRLAATRLLAQYAGVEQVSLFGKDEEIGLFLPAPGLRQTLRNGKVWQEFLCRCAQSGAAHATMPAIDAPEDVAAWGMCDPTLTAIIVFFGVQPAHDARTAIEALLPLLGSKLVSERAALAAAGHAAAARDSHRRASELNAALDVSRRELQSAYERAERELTFRRKAEQKLREGDRRKDEFLAMLAHELRNPLAPIGMAAQYLQVGPVTPARLRQTTEIIDRQIRHMTRLLDDLLDVSRVTSGRIELDQSLHDLRALVADAVEQARPLIDARHHILKVHLPDEPTTVHGDATRIVQIITNLLNNAAKYTPERGAIGLELTHGADSVQLTVRDNGIGIAPGLLPNMFDLFVQGDRAADRGQGGLGLGLALVKSLVELHGGTVEGASPGTGAGSQFTVLLPRAQGPGRVLAAEPSFAASASLDILVVDDNTDAAETLSMFLEALGHLTRIAPDGATALELAGCEAPRVFLLDIGLPDMDGYELARRLRALPGTSGATLIALTGYSQPADRERACAAGFDHHLTKPVDATALARLLASLHNPG
jgi:signal transduction histidine kinase